MPETPKYAWDYEFHFSEGEPCFTTLSDQDVVVWDENGATVALHDKDGDIEGSLNIERARLNWHKRTRRVLETAK